MIRLASPHIDDRDVAAVERVLRSGHLVQGREVAAFEALIAAEVGSRNAVALNSCTSALHVALLALGIKSGDEIAVPAYSWPATANVVAFCGATPVFIDIDPDSFTLRPDHLEAALLANPRIKAVIPVHAFGAMAEMDQVVRMCAQRSIAVIEDAACALGASRAGVMAGRAGIMGCFSFHPRKAITTGEGGVVVTDDDDCARTIRMLRNHGQDPDSLPQDFAIAGLNLRMTELQAALGRSQLSKLHTLVDGRRQAARRYSELLKHSGIRTPLATSDESHVYQSFIVLLPTSHSSERDAILTGLRERGVEAAIGTHHIPLLTFYRNRYGYKRGDFPVTDMVAASAIALPLHSSLTEEEQEGVVESLRAVSGL